MSETVKFELDEVDALMFKEISGGETPIEQFAEEVVSTTIHQVYMDMSNDE